jgi:hypothetical protein
MPSFKSSKTEHRSGSNQHLQRKMSEVISLREKVAQAELAVRVFGPPLNLNDEEVDRLEK